MVSGLNHCQKGHYGNARPGPEATRDLLLFDAQGIVDSYVETLLTDMVKNLSELVIVVNGELTATSYAKLSAFTDNIILRENKGLDAWAYKTALESYGWDRLVEFDEVILFNATIMGPVYPFEEMFTEMAAGTSTSGASPGSIRCPMTPSGMRPRGIFRATSSPTSMPTGAPWSPPRHSRTTGTTFLR